MANGNWLFCVGLAVRTTIFSVMEWKGCIVEARKRDVQLFCGSVLYIVT